MCKICRTVSLPFPVVYCQLRQASFAKKHYWQIATKLDCVLIVCDEHRGE